ncbi:hypothetical protein DE146DRAFT_680304 [Phaeosphaeria sp. MPI-PUGE-AT-0046c]|nr:hypothetical protein DE146DRAFT_680304 [Phaeosphaeria sp. MPI-PUGE-AT-0046c]
MPYFSDRGDSTPVYDVPKRAVRSEIEELFRSKGLVLTNIQLTVDRFTFHNNGLCFVELSSEEEAQKALKALHGTGLKDSNIKAIPVKEDFVWGGQTKSRGGSRFFIDEGENASEALRPLIEGRRKMLCVQPPGWLSENSSVGHNQKARQVVQDHFGKYGIETIGKLEPFFGDKLSHVRMLGFIDFATKDGADRVVKDFENTEIEGRKVCFREVVMAPWRAHQVGKVNAALLAKLQQKGLASKETYEDKFDNSDQKKGAENYNTTRMQRELKKQKAMKAEPGTSEP